jgi:hypothetical protein
MGKEIKIDLMKIKGIGEATVKKLREAGFTDEKLLGSTTEDLIKAKIDEPLASKIVKEIKEIIKEEKVQEEVKVEEPILEPEPQKTENDNENTEPAKTSDFDLSKQDKYLIAGFKASKHYNENLEVNDLKNSFEKYIKGE